MKVGLWPDIRRLAEIENLSARMISRRLHCSWRTVAQALELEQPPARSDPSRVSLLDPHKAKIDALLAKYPGLSAVRIHEEIARGPDGYTGSVITVRRYVRSIRPARGRVYQEVHYEPAQAMQVDWGECGRVQVGNSLRLLRFPSSGCRRRRENILTFQRKLEPIGHACHVVTATGPPDHVERAFTPEVG